MDFVTDLPPNRDGESKVFDNFFVVVNRYTKMAKYIPVLKSIMLRAADRYAYTGL
jgi:hypothetical protein